MVFFVNLLFSVIYSFCIGQWYYKKQISSIAFLLLFLPLVGVWLLICGGQDGVGTDYGSYLGLFNGEFIDYYKKTGEILFYYIVFYANQIGLKGQILFYIFYSIGFVFFFLIIRKLQIKYVFIFILLYITISNLFNNQLNTLRQTIAVYIGTYAIIQLFDKKKIYFFILWIIASMIHISAYAFILFCSFLFVKKMNCKILYIIFLSSIVLGILLNVEFLLENLPFDYLPITYTHYATTGHLDETNFVVRLTKYIFIPLYWNSIILIKYKRIKDYELMLYNAGFVSVCIRFLLINISYVSRLSELFLILSLFPLYYYLRDLYIHRKRLLFFCIVIGLILFYALKTVLFPKGEYLYNSIYF